MTIIELEPIIENERVVVVERVDEEIYIYHFIGIYKTHKKLTDVCQNMWLYKKIKNISPQLVQHQGFVELEKLAKGLTLVISLEGYDVDEYEECEEGL